MTRFFLMLPALYGDHHVTEIRRILSALEGVGEVYASSSFQLVELEYDPDRISPESIQAALQEAGYLEEGPAPVEIHGDPSDRDAEQPFFRRTASIPALKKTVSFRQEIPQAVRSLWPCPGMSPIRSEEEADHA